MADDTPKPYRPEELRLVSLGLLSHGGFDRRSPTELVVVMRRLMATIDQLTRERDELRTARREV